MDKTPLLSRMSRNKKMNLLLKYLSPQSKILEVGSGKQWFSQALRDRGYQVTTLDIEEEADFMGDVNDWKNLGLVQGFFDAVVAWEVIEHVECIQSLKDLCASDGLIFLSSPHPQWDWIMKILEALGLNQKRTSEHCNLTDFKVLPLVSVFYQRPLGIHQVGVFRKQ